MEADSSRVLVAPGSLRFEKDAAQLKDSQGPASARTSLNFQNLLRSAISGARNHGMADLLVVRKKSGKAQRRIGTNSFARRRSRRYAVVLDCPVQRLDETWAKHIGSPERQPQRAFSVLPLTRPTLFAFVRNFQGRKSRHQSRIDRVPATRSTTTFRVRLPAAWRALCLSRSVRLSSQDVRRSPTGTPGFLRKDRGEIHRASFQVAAAVRELFSPSHSTSLTLWSLLTIRIA
jgi:hypothetical protein